MGIIETYYYVNKNRSIHNKIANNKEVMSCKKNYRGAL